jgi:ribosome-associated translation inhibitor RaiA
MTHTPLQTTYRNMPPSDAVEEDIRQRLAKLEDVTDRITSCRVLIEAPTEHHRHGGLFRVRVELALPGEMLVVGDPPDHDHAHEDAHVAIRDAFKAARRRLVARRTERRRRAA